MTIFEPHCSLGIQSHATKPNSNSTGLGRLVSVAWQEIHTATKQILWKFRVLQHRNTPEAWVLSSSALQLLLFSSSLKPWITLRTLKKSSLEIERIKSVAKKRRNMEMAKDYSTRDCNCSLVGLGKTHSRHMTGFTTGEHLCCPQTTWNVTCHLTGIADVLGLIPKIPPAKTHFPEYLTVTTKSLHCKCPRRNGAQGKCTNALFC